MPNVAALLLDLDKTLYDCPSYLDEGEKGEVCALANAWGLSYESALSRFEDVRKCSIQADGRKLGRNEAVLRCGFSLDWWNEARCRCYNPEKHLQPYQGLAYKLGLLNRQFQIAVVSNSPTPLVHRVLSAIGLGESKKDWVVLGTNDGPPKPDSGLYRLAAEKLGVPFDRCLSIGDNVEMDALPAMRLGMGAIVVESVGDLVDLFEGLLVGQAAMEKSFDISRLLDLYRPGEVAICGFTGQAGAGKTTSAHLFHQLSQERGVPSAKLSLDYFFRKSSRERKLWLEEGKRMGPEEYNARADQMAWWDFDRMIGALDTLRRGRDLHLRNTYNRADAGELTLDVDIRIPKEGLLVICEGVAIAHLCACLSLLVYLHAKPEVRKRRLQSRDAYRRGPEAEERFRLTERFEHGYFSEHMHRAHMFVDTGKSVPEVMSAPPALAEL